jgi:hypothetical protein
VATFSTGGGINVTLVGSTLSTTTDSSGRFVLQGVAAGNAVLRFQGKGVDATVGLSGLVEGQTLTITVQVSGSQAELVSPTGEEVDLSGTVESVTPPSLKVSGRTIVTNAATKIKRGDQTIALASLKVGDKVEVEGTSQPDGRVLASKIKVEGSGDGEQDDGEDS